MNYKVKIEDGVLKARIDGHHSIWMHRAPRSSAAERKPGLYLLVDDRGYCCYVGETDNFKARMGTHESHDKFCWWSHCIYFWDEGPHSAFSSTDDRRWYEKQLKEAIEARHPTFTKSVQNKPQPESGDDVLGEIFALLDVIGFDVGVSSPVSHISPSTPSPVSVKTSSRKGSPFPYAVGKVVQAVFPILQGDSRLTAKAIAELHKPESSATFKTGGWPVLKDRTGKTGETRDKHGYNRYYDKIPLVFFGKPYWITSQFSPQGIVPILNWLSGLGLSHDEVLDVCKKRWG